MLTRARTLLSRVFSSENQSSQVRLDNVFDDLEDETSDENEHDQVSYSEIESTNSTTNRRMSRENRDDDVGDDDDDDDDDDESLTDSEDEWSEEFRSSTASANNKSKTKYQRQINENPSTTSSSARNFNRSHEKSRQEKIINAMQIATSRCNVESMKRLLTNFDIDINHRDQYGMSYLEHAILMGSFDMVDLLIRFGCDLYQGDSNGHSYLYVSIETTSNKSLPIIRLLLESNCSCLRVLDIASIASPQQLLFINSQDFLLLNSHLLFILKYQIRRMVLSDVLNLVSYLILTNVLLCKNDEHYGLSACSKNSLKRFIHDYLNLFVKNLSSKHSLKLEQKLKSSLNSNSTPSSLIPLESVDVQSVIHRLHELNRQVFELKHFCRLLIRQNLKNLKSSTIETVVKNVKLQDFLLYTPI